MGLLSSFNIGVTGLAATGSGISVVGDNIANAGTNGFKYSRPEFQDVLASSLKGIEGGNQFGAGTRLAHITPIFIQGNIARTEIATDLAVNGNGFFTLEADFGYSYTRDGAFHFDKEGYLINADDYKVLGFAQDRNGKLSNKVAPVRLGNTTIPAAASSNVDVSMNLDSRENITKFDPKTPTKTSNFSTSVTVYDNIGTARLATLYFNKTADNQWEYHALVDGADAQGGKEGEFVEMASGRLVFNNKGVLQEEVESKNSFNFNKGALQGQKIEFNFGKSLKEGGDGLEASTQYGSKSNIGKTYQNGASAGTLASLSFDDEGVLKATYDNGETRDIAQIAVSKFENNEGLFKMGKNLFKETRKSGQAAIGRPGDSGRGRVLAKSLELSNVDIANEFVNLMTMQRNFQANARTITTADQMLQEVFNIKR